MRSAPPSGRLVLIRHGETEWSLSGQHTGRTDIPLTDRGVRRGALTPQLLTGFDFALALTSPLQRAARTAELAGLDAQTEPDLVEWDYGGYEGITTDQIRERLGYDWEIFADGVVPGATQGETLQDVAARAAQVLRRVTPSLYAGDVALVSHGHTLRILATVFLRQPPQLGAQLALEAGSVSVLGYERELPAIQQWNRVIPADDHE